ncbi:hypothetical protein ACF08M_10945 [Streptomyces sp. NPDC015032]|uniref:hypothetical protein n=1 Tax=Streptomyces sp. NPDC015032 TaxID=3364937 RepID=UPI0036FF5C69
MGRGGEGAAAGRRLRRAPRTPAPAPRKQPLTRFSTRGHGPLGGAPHKVVGASLTAPDGTSEDKVLAAVDPTYKDDVRRETVSGKLADAYGKDAMSVGETYATKHHIEVGDRITVAFKGGGSARRNRAARPPRAGRLRTRLSQGSRRLEPPARETCRVLRVAPWQQPAVRPRPRYPDGSPS